MRDARRKRRTVAEYGPEPVDVHVGSRVRLRRTLLGMSQTDIADALGLTFQQVQKNERGLNRIGASRLYHLSHVLDVPLSFFFDDMPPPDEDDASGLRGGVQEPSAPDLMDKRETLELVRAYYRIPDPKVRDALRYMAFAMGERTGTP